MYKDCDLLDLILKKPDNGLDELMNTYTGFVYIIVNNKIFNVCNKQDIEECVSDVFIDFYNNIKKIDLSKGSIKAYLAVIAKRRAIDEYRKRIKLPYLSSIDSDEDIEYSDMSTDIEEIITKSEVKTELINEIKGLGEPDKEILIRKYFLGQRTKEIALALNMNTNTVDKRVSRGLKKLRSLIGGVDNV